MSGALLLIKSNPVLFLVLYFMCGISDVLDGYLARRYGWETKAGAKLDSLSDFIFYVIILNLLFFMTDILSQAWLLIGLAVIFLLRIANVLITKMKFSEWGMLHSWANKIMGLLLYLYIPFALLGGSVSLIPGITLCIVAFVSALEEMMIIVSAKEYDANRKSYFL